MKNFNYLQTILASLFVFLPIFPHSNSIDFGGYTDPSLILIIIFLATGINSNRIIGLAFTIFLYLSINDYVGYADTFSKIFLDVNKHVPDAYPIFSIFSCLLEIFVPLSLANPNPNTCIIFPVL